MHTELRRGAWLTVFLVVATLEAMVDLGFRIDAPADALGSGIEPWQFLVWRASAAVALIAVVSIWFWSRFGVVAYGLAAMGGPIVQALHHASINWLPVAAVGILGIFVRHKWKCMPWGVLLKRDAGMPG